MLEQLAGAGMFVLSSRFEGFPNALVEAMACGRAVISTNCSSGPQDLIEMGRNGLLVPADNADQLALRMEQLILDPRLRSQLGNAALKIRADLSMGKVLWMWNSELTRCGCPVVERGEMLESTSRAA